MLKSAARIMVAQPFIGRLLWQLRRGRSAIVMMHRFADADAEYAGHDPTALHALLDYLRACQVQFESVDALIARALTSSDDEMANAPPSVAFTVDDGYEDVARLAQPVFAKFDCPFTVFVVPEVVDGQSIFWWDQLAWIIRHSQKSSLSLTDGQSGPWHATWTDRASAFVAQKAIEEHLKYLSPEQIVTTLRDLSMQADVPLLTKQPTGSEVLSWERLRELERLNVRFGAHSMTHPILTSCGDEQARWEIRESISRVRQEVANPSQIFCYPNGRRRDFATREVEILAEAGMLGAISSEPGLAIFPGSPRDRAHWRWRVPRISYDYRPGTLLRAYFD